MPSAALAFPGVAAGRIAEKPLVVAGELLHADIAHFEGGVGGQRHVAEFGETLGIEADHLFLHAAVRMGDDGSRSVLCRTGGGQSAFGGRGVGEGGESARTFWHSHPRGQIFYVTDGIGWTQERGGPRITVRAGDTVRCPPDVVHWHGASDSSPMTHLAVGERVEGRSVSWFEAVSDDDYLTVQRAP